MWDVMGIVIRTKEQNCPEEAERYMQEGWEPFSVTCEGWDSQINYAMYMLWLRRKREGTASNIKFKW